MDLSKFSGSWNENDMEMLHKNITGSMAGNYATKQRFNVDPKLLYEEIKKCAPHEKSYDLNDLGDLKSNSWKSICRIPFIKNYSWAIPCEESIEAIKNFVGSERVLEIGSGSGIWAYLMKCNGIDVIATDNFNEKPAIQYMPIEVLDMQDAIEKYNPNVLMICWGRFFPQNFNGSKLVIIGEPPGGCTVSYPSEESDTSVSWKIEKFLLKKWFGLHDDLYFCTKQGQVENK